MGNANRRTIKPAVLGTFGVSSGLIASGASLNLQGAMRWSDFAASRKSTYPDAAPIKPILNIIELYEQILSNLSTRDLLLARGVSRTFLNTVDKSPSLRQALFLKADPDATSHAWVLDSDGKLLVGEKAKDYVKSTQHHNNQITKTEVLRINPLVLSTISCVHLERLASESITSGKSGVYHDQVINDAYSLDSEALFYQMYLTQPPATKVEVKSYGWSWYADWEDRRGLPKWYETCVGEEVIENVDGVTVVHVLTAVRNGYHYADRGRYRVVGWRSWVDLLWTRRT